MQRLEELSARFVGLHTDHCWPGPAEVEIRADAPDESEPEPAQGPGPEPTRSPPPTRPTQLKTVHLTDAALTGADHAATWYDGGPQPICSCADRCDCSTPTAPSRTAPARHFAATSTIWSLRRGREHLQLQPGPALSPTSPPKTFTGWRYDALGPTSVLWTSPHRRRYLVDDTGSRDVTDTELVRRHGQDLGPPGDGCHYTLAG